MLALRAEMAWPGLRSFRRPPLSLDRAARPRLRRFREVDDPPRARYLAGFHGFAARRPAAGAGRRRTPARDVRQSLHGSDSDGRRQRADRPGLVGEGLAGRLRRTEAAPA